MEPMEVAQVNFAKLRNNIYPGRGIVVGRDWTGEYLVQVYLIMGRSPNSRNRVLSHDGSGRVFTEPADPKEVKDQALIIYNAMDEYLDFFVVTNGNQTDAITRQSKMEMKEYSDPLSNSFIRALSRETYEPDVPNFTPRISGFCSLEKGPRFGLSLLRKAPKGEGCERSFYTYDDFAPGFARGITTYSGDGDPLPSFEGEPILLPMMGGLEALAECYWSALNANNRISLVVKFIDVDARSRVHVINKFSKVGKPNPRGEIATYPCGEIIE